MYTSSPDVAVSREGQVYIATDFLVSRVTTMGDLKPVAGTGKRPPGADCCPAPDLGDFPRPGTSSPLPHLSGIAATPSGGVVVATENAVMELDLSGALHLVADPATTAEEGAIEAVHVDEDGSVGVGSHLGPVEVTDAGDVLVGDLAKKRILRIRDGRSTVFVADSSYLSLVRGSALLADDAGLLVRRQGDLAVYGLPD